MTITNAMRLLKQAGIEYGTSEYEVDESDLSGVHAARMLGIDPDCMFKTLVTRGEKKGIYVFCIPVAEELDLKKAAAAVGEKALEMLKSKELLPLTGYIHGGCSPIGMKKQFRTFIHETALSFATILFSAGKIGYQVECSLEGLRKAIPVECADLIVG